jgi:hypothetical protein
MASDNEDLRAPSVVDLEKAGPAPTAHDAVEAEEDDFPTDPKKIALIMASIYMSMFLVALVSHVTISCQLERRTDKYTSSIGSNDIGHGYPENH